VTLAEPFIEIVAFSFASPKTVGPGLDHLLRTFVARFGNQLSFYRTGDMKHYRAFDAQALDGPYHWFARRKLLATEMLGFMAHAGCAENTITPPEVDLALMGFDEPPSFVVRLTLPVKLGGAPDDLVSFVQQLLATFELDSGYVGYSFAWNRLLNTDRRVCQWAAPLLLRHPGLGYGKVVALSNAADRGVVAVSWLTLLGPALGADLGGHAQLEKSAPRDVSVLPLGQGGTLLRAGAAPQLGDANRQDLLPTYHAVGRLVAPRRAPDNALEDVGITGMTEEQADGWLRRFFD
jgi:hypothetical protein